MLGLCRNTWSCCWKKKLFAHISKKWTLKVNLGSNWVFGYLSIGYLSISTFESLPCAIKYARMVEASGWQGEEKNLEKTWSTTKQKLSEKLKSCGKPAGGHILVGSRQNCTYSWQFIFYHLHSHWIKFVWITKKHIWKTALAWSTTYFLKYISCSFEFCLGCRRIIFWCKREICFVSGSHVYVYVSKSCLVPPPSIFLWEKSSFVAPAFHQIFSSLSWFVKIIYRYSPLAWFLYKIFTPGLLYIKHPLARQGDGTSLTV